MISYVDRLLVHWAQEFSVKDQGVSLGMAFGWSPGIQAAVSADSELGVTARGVASRPTSARAGVSRVAERINTAVESLPTQLQEVVRLHYLECPGLSGAEKADILRCSLRSFHNYIHRAHEQISAALPDSYVQWSLKYAQG